jgi:hypothetical protein
MQSPQIWSNVQERVAHLLVLRDAVVELYKVTGWSWRWQRKLQRALEALQQGRTAVEVGSTPIEVLIISAVSRAEASPDNGALMLYADGECPKQLSFATADKNANEIVRRIVTRSGRTFQTMQEDIEVIDALSLPLKVGVSGAFIWLMLYGLATSLVLAKAWQWSGFGQKANDLRSQGEGSARRNLHCSESPCGFRELPHEGPRDSPNVVRSRRHGPGTFRT